MNKDILAGKWKEMKGRVKEQWGKITDDSWIAPRARPTDDRPAPAGTVQGARPEVDRS